MRLQNSFSSLLLSIATLSCGVQLVSARGPPLRDFQQFNSDTPTSQVITGLYADNSAEAQIVIHDVNGVPSWSWSVDDAKTQAIPADLLACIQQHTAVPEAKWANDGSSVITIYNFAALMINHLPGDPRDKQITFGVCLNWNGMENTHSLEVVPDGKIAIATTCESNTANIKIFDLASGLQAQSNPVEALNFLPAVHGLVWDQKDSLLWAVGSYNSPDGTAESRSALHAYKYAGGVFQPSPLYSFNVSAPTILSTEWSGTEYNGWWDGGHDLIGVPNKRQLLISTDLDLHAFDIDSQTFESGEVVVEKYLPGFTPVDNRVGSNGQALPRSDVKSLSLDGNHHALYVQAAWQEVVSYQINRLQNGQVQPGVIYKQQLYRSRWFEDTPAWPKARIPR